MIIRIMGEGQWVVDPEELVDLNHIDEQIEAAAKGGNQDDLAAGLQKLNDRIRSLGNEVPDDMLVESDLVLPANDATVDEVRALLESTSEFYGLLPDTAADAQALMDSE